MDSNDKLDLILNKLEQHDKKFDEIIADNKKEHERLDRRITKVEANMEEKFLETKELLHSINAAFIRYETEGQDKMNILFDSYKDNQDHQKIYGHEFIRLNDLVAKNSFRISNLERNIYSQ